MRKCHHCYLPPSKRISHLRRRCHVYHPWLPSTDKRTCFMRRIDMTLWSVVRNRKQPKHVDKRDHERLKWSHTYLLVYIKGLSPLLFLNLKINFRWWNNSLFFFFFRERLSLREKSGISHLKRLHGLHTRPTAFEISRNLSSWMFCRAAVFQGNPVNKEVKNKLAITA